MTTTLQELDEVQCLLDEARAKNQAHDFWGEWELNRRAEECARQLIRKHAPEIRAALELQAKLEQGFVLVPRESLEQIADGIYSRHHNAKVNEHAYDTAWFGAMLEYLEAMLNAAPPAQGEQE